MSSKHFLTIRVPSKPCWIYYDSNFGWMPRFFYLDSKGNDVPMMEYRISRESITTSKKQDAYNNRNCLHTYCEAVLEPVMPLLKRTEYQMGDGDYNAIRYTTSSYISMYIPGRRDIPSNSIYTMVYSNDASGAYTRTYTKDGRLSFEQTVTSGAFTRTGYHIIRNSAVHTAVTHYADGTKVPSKWIDTETNYDAQYCGYYAGGYTPSWESILTLLPDMRPVTELCPSSITDDIFSKFTIPNVNNCENLKDLKDFKEVIPPILQVIKKRNIKSLSQLYLWYKYTYSTSKMDLEAYIKFFENYITETVSHMSHKHISLCYKSAGTQEYLSPILGYNSSLAYLQETRYNLYTNTYNGGIVDKLGLRVDLSNTWDMIPFSFVVDWFIGIGNVLSQLDESDWLSQVSIYSVVTSNKVVGTNTPFVTLGIPSTVKYVTYMRNVSDVLPIAAQSFSLLNPFHHIVDGAALIFTNKY